MTANTRIKPSDLLPQPLTDSGNGERLVKQHGRNIRFCVELKSWFTWDDKRWKRDMNGRIHRMAKETARTLYMAALTITDQEARTRMEAFARASESAAKIRAMLECGRNEPNISVSANDFDRDPWSLNCQNGTLDLRSGELRQHSRTDLITKMCAVSYDPKAECPLFLRFLNEILNGNAELIAYVRRAVGYSLTGDVSEKALFCFVGDGNNGKTTLLEVLRYVLGDYAGQVMIESLLSNNMFHRSTALADLADLQGARLVTTSEADEGVSLAEATIKQLTGMGQMKTCRKYENPVTFSPDFKLFMDSNHKPTVRGTDAAIWNRLKLIPFIVTIAPDEIDKTLLGKLKREAKGILRWAVEGCLEWQSCGLMEPPQVTESVNGWKADSDPFAGFFETRCELKSTATVAASSLWDAFKRHAEAADVIASQRQFIDQLRRLGCEPGRTKDQRYWTGIHLRG
jgi:putative DNA primase/helicase